MTKTKPIQFLVSLVLVCCWLVALSVPAFAADDTKTKIQAMYGENKRITGEYDNSLAVTCENGTFVGKQEENVVAYKGIPYAEQPVGELRWKDPVAAKTDDGVYEAYYYGHAAIQSEWVSETGSYYPQGEDCLNLNVWVNPKNHSKKKPVMVFIHGGSYGWGGTADPLYDGHSLVEKYDDVIVVTIAYRLGLLGFMDLSEVEGGEDYKTSGNLGLLDQLCALQWIHDNIMAFGGNPDNVTIWGESAGAGSVSLLPLMEGSEGLFQRMIAESGSVALTSPKDECLKLTDLFMEKSGCSTMEEFTALPIEEFVELNETLNDYNNFPERDGVVLPEDPYHLYEEGAASGVDMLIGSNQDEARYWICEMDYTVPVLPGKFTYTLGVPVLFENNLKGMDEHDREVAKAYVKDWPDNRTWSTTELYNELLFRLPCVYQAEQNSLHGGNTYMYYWKYPSGIKDLGACHAVELAYVFDNLDETIYTGGNVNAELADAVQDMWVNFARTGNPSTEDHAWHSYDTENRYTMVLDSTIHEEKDILTDSRETLSPLLRYYLHGHYAWLSMNVPQVYKILGGVLGGILVVALAVIGILKSLKSKKASHG